MTPNQRELEDLVDEGLLQEKQAKNIIQDTEFRDNPQALKQAKALKKSSGQKLDTAMNLAKNAQPPTPTFPTTEELARARTEGKKLVKKHLH